MIKKNNVPISLLLLLVLITITVLTSCGGNEMQPDKVLEEYLEIIQKESVDKLCLTIYYIDPMLLTIHPLSVDNLIKYNGVTRIVVSGIELKEHVDLLKQMCGDELKTVRKTSRIDARIYYVFETEKEGKVLEIAMWGDNNSVFVNDLEVKENDIFFKLINPFLTEEAINDLEPFLRNLD